MVLQSQCFACAFPTDFTGYRSQPPEVLRHFRPLMQRAEATDEEEIESANSTTASFSAESRSGESYLSLLSLTFWSDSTGCLVIHHDTSQTT